MPTGAEPSAIVCSCGRRLKARGAVPGRRGRCPTGGAEFVVPEPAPTADPPPPIRSFSRREPVEEPPSTGYELAAGHGSTSSSYVRTRHVRAAEATAGGPIGRGGLLAPTAEAESGLAGNLLFPLRDMTGLGWIILMSLVLTPFSLAVSGLWNQMKGGELFALGVFGLLALGLMLIVGYGLGFLNAVAVEAASGEVVHPRWPEFDLFAILGNFGPWLAAGVASLPPALPAHPGFALAFGTPTTSSAPPSSASC